MDKSKQKREKYHPLAVNKVAEMYGYSARYIRQILKGDRKGLMADNVLRDYKQVRTKGIMAVIRRSILTTC
ncbi:hypothetical protein ACILE8_08435 [Capnocytophaga canimorsus]|uniref:hypothetical protein n=1 Tax=Capnocytophaga canimorsus TaxID=28188 RepID=UPI0037D12A8B